MGQAEDPNRSLNVVITGDAGLIGGVLMPYLTAMGHTVRRLTRQGSDPTWSDLIWRPAEGALDPSHFDRGAAVGHLADCSASRIGGYTPTSMKPSPISSGATGHEPTGTHR